MRAFGFALIIIGLMVIWLSIKGKLGAAVQALLTGEVPPEYNTGSSLFSTTVTGKSGTQYTVSGNNTGGVNITNKTTGQPATNLNDIPAQYRQVPSGR